MKLVTELKLLPNFTNKDIILKIAKKCNVKTNDILNFEIIKQGIDARHKPEVFYVLNVAVNFKDSVKNKLKNLQDIFPDHSGLIYEKKERRTQPVIVGFGPSGMFLALALSLAGYNPIVLEQGECVEEREKSISKFWNERELNEYSNVQFGEGGAGTFSDGKLNTTLNNSYCNKVINELILNGAPSEIFYKNKAHIGTDNLKVIVKNIREKIIKNGGKVIFNAHFYDFLLKNNEISGIFYKDIKNNTEHFIETNKLFLAIGHSAIKTYELLNSKNVIMNQKPFAMGVRVEHEQSLINISQYGKDDKNLPSADYKLVEHLKSGRSVFTFCMCPGGEVVASSSECGTIVTNGMSEFARNMKFANSALLVNVNPNDYNEGNVLDGLYYQRKFEKLAFSLAGSNYNAPAQTIGSFLNGENDNNYATLKNNETINNEYLKSFELKNKKTELNQLDNKNIKQINNCAELEKYDENSLITYYNQKEKGYSYKMGLTFCDISKCLPSFVSASLKEAIPLLAKKIKGFDGNNNILIAPETRSSSPVQFKREENYTCTYKGLYAVGEGAGFAGGIISSAVDGLKCAELFLTNNNL